MRPIDFSPAKSGVSAAIASSGEAGATGTQAHQLARDAAAAAVHHANDDLLADVTALREADRAIFDPRFQRNRLRRHVHAKQRPPRLDTPRVPGGVPDRLGAGGDERAADRLSPARTITIEAQCISAKLARSGDHHGMISEAARPCSHAPPATRSACCRRPSRRLRAAPPRPVRGPPPAPATPSHRRPPRPP